MRDLARATPFTHIFVDEAAQVLEPDALIPLSLGNETTRFMVAGDSKQRTPYIFNRAEAAPLSATMLERLARALGLQGTRAVQVALLRTNYRQEPRLASLLSHEFYDGLLASSPDISRWDPGCRPLGLSFPLAFVDVSDVAVLDKTTLSCYNMGQARAILDTVKRLKKTWPEQWGEFDDGKIGVVIPTAAQRKYVRKVLRSERFNNIFVDVVDSVQGREFPVVLMCTVFDKAPSSQNRRRVAEASILLDWRTFNTIATRARMLCVCIGSVEGCERADPFWRSVVATCRKENTIRSASISSALSASAPEFVAGMMPTVFDIASADARTAWRPVGQNDHVGQQMAEIARQSADAGLLRTMRAHFSAHLQ